jgi:hypothetical protein
MLAPRLFHRPLAFITRRAAIRLGILLLVSLVAGGLFWLRCINMPGRSHVGPPVPLDQTDRALAAELERDVRILASDIGHRSTFHTRQYAKACAWAREQLVATGLDVIDHSFVARGSPAPNIQATLRGSTHPNEIIVIGAHIDSFQGTPGADDNASGVAGLLAMARRFADMPRERTIRFVIFVNEEPPAFWTDDMGSRVYVKKCVADGDTIIAMFSLEAIGTFDDAPGSQRYPKPLDYFYPDRGNFIAIVGNTSSVALTRRAVGVFRDTTPLPCEGACLPWWLPGVGWSDHSSFWDEGIPAAMVTTTALFRNPRYHTEFDTPDMLDYARMTRVVQGMSRVLDDLASGE